MAKDWKEHQAELARSGNRVPDNFYIESEPVQSSEEQSGDGGANVNAEPAGEAIPMRSAEEARAAAEAARTVDPETGQTIPKAVEAQAQGKQGAAPAENKAEDLDSMTKAELVALADERGVEVTRGDGEDGDPVKADYVRALS